MTRRAWGAAGVALLIGAPAVVDAAGVPRLPDVPITIAEIPGERLTQMPMRPVDELSEPGDDCSFLGDDIFRFYILAVEPHDDLGWSARWSNPSGIWFNTGSIDFPELAWHDIVRPPGVNSSQSTTEDLVIIEETDNSLIVRIDHVAFPNDGPAQGVRSTCTYQFAFPSEMKNFIKAQPGPGSAIPTVADLSTVVTDTHVALTGMTSAPPGSYVELWLETSGLDGSSRDTATGVVDDFGRFGLGVSAPVGGIDCFFQLSIDGWVVESDTTECPLGVPPTPIVTNSVDIDGTVLEVTSPQSVTSNGRLPFTLCGSTADGPLSQQFGFISLGNDRTGELATHSAGIFGNDGCYSGAVMVREPPGTVPLFTSDGSSVAQVAELEVFGQLIVELPALPDEPIDDDAADDDIGTDDGSESADDASADDTPADDGSASDEDATADGLSTDGDGAATGDDVTTDDDIGTDDGSESADDATDDGGGFPIWIPLVLFGGLVVGGGVWFFRSRLGGDSAATSRPDDLSMDDLEQYVDRDLGTTTDVYTGTTIASGAPVVGAPPSTDDRWIALLDDEQRVQREYLDDYSALLEEVGQAYQQYNDAIGKFHEKFLKVASGSTELQGYLQRWQDNQQTAKKQDIAFAIITIVWGIGKLGISGARWITGSKAAGEAAEGGATAGTLTGSADDLATADTVLGGAATVIDEGRTMSNLGREATQQYLDEIGMSWERWVQLNGNSYQKAWATLYVAVARSRGWVTMTDDASQLIHRLITNGHLAAAGRGPGVDPADLAQLGEWASRPGFWDKLLMACVEMDDEIALLFGADDVRFLKALLASEGDVSALGHLLGPAQGASLNVAAGVVASTPSLAGLGFSGGKVVVNSANLGHDVATYDQTAETIDHLDLGAYTDQFGGWASSWNDGLGWFMLDSLWSMFTSPFEWFSGILHTGAAMDRYADFLDGSRDDLLELGSSLGEAIDALRDLRGAIDRADLDDPTSSLGGSKAAELRGVLSDMNDLFSDAPESWREAHRAELDERRAHIEQKITQIEATLDALFGQLALLQQLADQLDSARRNDDGSLRDVVDLWNPGLLVTLGSIDLTLRSIIGTALFGASQPVISAGGESAGDFDPWIGTDDLVDGQPDSLDWDPELADVFVRTGDD